jgi:hypothetical protein
VFRRVSEIAPKILLHDAMVMVFFDEPGQIALDGNARLAHVRPHVAPTPVPDLIS